MLQKATDTAVLGVFAFLFSVAVRLLKLRKQPDANG